MTFTPDSIQRIAMKAEQTLVAKSETYNIANLKPRVKAKHFTYTLNCYTVCLVPTGSRHWIRYNQRLRSSASQNAYHKFHRTPLIPCSPLKALPVLYKRTLTLKSLLFITSGIPHLTQLFLLPSEIAIEGIIHGLEDYKSAAQVYNALKSPLSAYIKDHKSRLLRIRCSELDYHLAASVRGCFACYFSSGT
ncbi:hypothetical protein M501DRAFT_53860 [Patellaria atrata CBS 101060]|uniref:Uncharacterized protein n=1 Tax=Patellaria atrata CBS 101060 TaxID=1346257 RepID=A0A9P4VVH5_9PEZI|nr:hypothetical protein M501DRAFT_53860 [Patellaria atrata CBS 101060]